MGVLLVFFCDDHIPVKLHVEMQKEETIASSGKEKKNVAIARIYSDSETGDSLFGTLKIPILASGDIGYLSEFIGTKGVQFRHTTADYNYSWHTAPRRQFIVNLDGAVEIEVSSGEKKVIGIGEVFFVEDTSGHGHFSRAVNNKPRNSLFLPVTESFQSCNYQ